MAPILDACDTFVIIVKSLVEFRDSSYLKLWGATSHYKRDNRVFVKIGGLLIDPENISYAIVAPYPPVDPDVLVLHPEVVHSQEETASQINAYLN